MYHNQTDKNYLDLIDLILNEGTKKGDRTGTGTISYFGPQMRFNLLDGFPLITVKKTYHKAITHEALWFLNAVDPFYQEFGNTNIKYLVDHNVSIWNEWAFEPYLKTIGKDYIKPNDPQFETEWKQEMDLFINKIKTDNEFAKQYGELGPVYGKQWTNWGSHTDKNGINQIEQIINKLRNRPDDRRIIVSAWNVAEIENMALPPCHAFFQFYSVEMDNNDRLKSFEKWARLNGYDITGMSVDQAFNHYNFPKRKLSVKLYQRSADVGLGVPFNIASYALILEMVAQVTGHLAYEFVHTFGDAHIYLNHLDKLTTLKENESYPLPTITLDKSIKELNDFRIEHISINNYKSHAHIPLKVAV